LLQFESLVRRRGISPHSTQVSVKQAGLMDLNGIERFRNLEFLDCSHNVITRLPDLSELMQLKVLDVSHNRLLELPSLPAMLRQLHCSHNQLTSIPADWSPRMLRHLNCGFNRIEWLPSMEELPLIVLDVRFNQLKRIPVTAAYTRVVLTEGNPIEPEEETEPSGEGE